MSRGFTLIEIILVISLVLIVSAATIPSYSKFINGRKLQSEQNKLVENIRYARELAESGKRNSNFGVYFQADRYVLYQGDSYGNRDSSQDQIFELSKNIELSNLNEVNFEKARGTPSATGTLRVTNTANEKFKDIKVNKEGLIYVTR